MSVGLLLVTHRDIGECLVQVAREILGEHLPLPIKVLGVRPDMQVEWLCAEVQTLCGELDEGDGVLILTDLYAATPCNVARKIQAERARTSTISGLNLSMLLKVLNYSALDLQHLAEKATSGGHQGIINIDYLLAPEQPTGNGAPLPFSR